MAKNIVICKDREKNEHEVFVEDLTFRPSVYGVIIEHGKILLSKQWDGFDLPGGGIELGETINDALIREIKEETGFDAEVNGIIDCRNSFFRTLKGKNFHSILLYYTCKIIGGSISVKYLDEAEKSYLGQAEWVDLARIENIKFYSSTDLVSIIKKAVNLI
jgi:8-oxo-dGTP diphosphatase